jgi:hypothetical protein
MAEILLDPDIRVWVFLPIVIITFLVGVVRHHITVLLTSDKTVDLTSIQDSQALIRSRFLRENGKYIPKQPFLRRKFFFNDEKEGYFKVNKREAQMKNPMTDPSMMTDMVKGNMTNVLPMIVIGGWINYAFSGFLTTKVPFPLTIRYKPMLQRGVELPSLDASWVSSASWYFLNVFGLRSFYSLVLGQDNAADQTKMMADQMTGAAMQMPPDPNKAFKAEWEQIQITEHHWALEGIEDSLIGLPQPPTEVYIKNKLY